MFTIKLKPKVKSRVQQGHPWCYLDEVTEHIRSVHPGYPVCLTDSEGQFIAYGVGNPQSQIAFRAWSFNSQDKNFFSQEFLQERIASTWRQKYKMGLTDSLRVCYSEGDNLSGLIFDRYLLPEGQGQIFVYQISSAAFEALIPDFRAFSQDLINRIQKLGISLPSIDQTSIVIRRSANFQKIENLSEKLVEVIQGDESALSSTPILYSRWPYGENTQIQLISDFIGGQKTGLFLDQSYNIGLVAYWAARLFSNKDQVRILDLCCYRGAWSTHLAAALKEKVQNIHVTLFDQSAEATRQAAINVAPFATSITEVVGDVMKDIEGLEGQFDLIISDPPAFAKSKKALNSALEGYYHLNRKAISKLGDEGVLVACSCSSVVTEGDFAKVLERTFLAHPQKQVQFLGQGGHAFDHSVNPRFMEGQYLKMRGYWICSGRMGS